MRRHATTALRLRRALRATVHAASRRAPRASRAPVAEPRPDVAHIVADLDEIDAASSLASSLAWRWRSRAQM